MTDAVADDVLMQRFCRGDEQAFDMLYQRHAAAVFAYINRLVRDPALAEDLLQTTFLSFVRARGRYEFGTNVRAWIYAIATNAARDALRRSRARPERLAVSDDGAASATASVPEPRDAGATRAIEEALMQLSPEQREAVVLHKLEELSFEEISSALGITVGTAKVRAHRGYQRLREILAPLRGEP